MLKKLQLHLLKRKTIPSQVGWYALFVSTRNRVPILMMLNGGQLSSAHSTVYRKAESSNGFAIALQRIGVLLSRKRPTYSTGGRQFADRPAGGGFDRKRFVLAGQ
jgi:hypothetical protein